MSEQVETVPQQRERIDAQNKEIAGLRKRNKELLSAAASAQFQSAGYNPKHAQLFVSQATEDTVPTPEAVQAFASEWDLGKPTTAAATDTVDDADPGGGDEPDDSQLAPDRSSLDALARSGSSTGGSSGGTAERKMTRAEYIEMSRTDKAQADTALRQGRVELSGDAPVPRGTNPYDS